MFLVYSTILLKLNPVNDYLLPVYEKIFQNFINKGYMVVTKGDVEVSKYMCSHKGIDHIHLTGSDETYENIVYGRNLTEEEKKLSTLPKKNSVSITSELGNVTPFIIHPGNWTNSQIKNCNCKIK